MSGRNMFCRRTAEWMLAAAVFLLPGCAGAPDEPRSEDAAHATSPSPTESLKPSGLQTAVPSSAGSSVSVTPPSAGGFASATPDEGGRASPFPAEADEKNRDDSIAVVADADDPLVLVNKTRKLPDGYRPPDLVQPDVPFVPTAPAERRLMRREAARALEELFAAAGRAGLDLKAVSGFRSYETQAALYAYYVRTEGEQHASQFSARPGHSEQSDRPGDGRLVRCCRLCARTIVRGHERRPLARGPCCGIRVYYPLSEGKRSDDRLRVRTVAHPLRRPRRRAGHRRKWPDAGRIRRADDGGGRRAMKPSYPHAARQVFARPTGSANCRRNATARSHTPGSSRARRSADASPR